MRKFILVLNTFLFISVLFIGGIMFWVLPKKSISEDENRKLKTIPVATAESVFSGKFEKEFEEYYNDHFPLRDIWIDISSRINMLKGYQDDEFRVINVPTQAQPSVSNSSNQEENDMETISSEDEQQENVQTESENIQINNDVEQQAESVEQAVETDKNFIQNTEVNTLLSGDKEEVANLPEIDDAEFNRVRGVIMVNNRVVQNFGGSKATISPYASMLNTYQKRFGNQIKLYALMIPAGSDYFLPKKVNKGVLKEKENLKLFNQLLDQNIIRVNAYDELAKHRNEYIYFYTDHHWTGLGAYYAYKAFAESAGIKPLELSEMTYIKKEKSFLGSLYNYTKDKALTKNPDYVEYYKIPNKAQATIYSGSQSKGRAGVVYAEFANNYGVFLGGDFALVHIKTDKHNGKNILLIKDSFGNALAPYLAAHYENVYVVDYRHYKGNVSSLIKDKKIQEVIYAHNSFAANSNAAVKHGLRILGK